MKDLGELDENLKILKAWRLEISDAEMWELGILPSFSIYNYLLANLTEINIYWLFMNIFPKKICS
jgi:hypothetical protein